MRILVSGSSGLIGSALCEKLESDGHEVVRLIRPYDKSALSDADEGAGGEGSANDSSADESKASEDSADENTAYWYPAEGRIEQKQLRGLEAVVHLAGAGIGDRPWTRGRKRDISQSRIRDTKLLATTLGELAHPPKVLLCGSAIGIYGEQGNKELTESDTPGISRSFLGNLCQQWEAATDPAKLAGIRVVNLRTGVVVARHAAFIRRQLPLFKLYLGGHIGKANRWISWISLEDEVNAISWLLKKKKVSGPVNLTSPNPVTNLEFSKTLGSVMDRPAWLPVPRFLPGIIMGQDLIKALTESTKVIPEVLGKEGFSFTYPDLESALREALPEYEQTAKEQTEDTQTEEEQQPADDQPAEQAD